MPSSALSWVVKIRYRTPNGTLGAQTLIVKANGPLSAVWRAWREARTPAAVAHRRGASLVPTPGALVARRATGTDRG